jgi:hypothetical protein
MVSDSGKRKKFAYAVCISNEVWSDVDCKICGRKWRQMLHYEKGDKGSVMISNKPLPDFMFYYVMLISEKVKDIFIEEGITGFELEKVLVKSFDKLTEEEETYCKEMKYKQKDFLLNSPDYYKLFVSNIGAEPHEKLGLKLVGNCDSCGYEKYEFNEPFTGILTPMIIKKESINTDYDIFKVRGSGLTMYCTEKIKNIYEKHKFTGIDFREIELL